MVKDNSPSSTTKTDQETFAEKCMKAQATWFENNFDIQSQTETKITYVRKRKVFRTLKEQWYIWFPIFILLAGNSLFDIMFGSLPRGQVDKEIGNLLGTVITPFLFGLWIYTKIDSQKVELEADLDAKCPKKYHLQK